MPTARLAVVNYKGRYNPPFTFSDWQVSEMPTVQEFAETFPSEQVLQQALAKLLSRIPDHSGVQILQGTKELGKDIIFYTPSAFGQRDLNACVVKNVKITGNAANAGGARTVFNQAQQALDTPLRDENGREQLVKRVFVITPHPIPPETVDSIVGALREARERVQFIGGAKLMELFKSHWPEYLAEEFKLVQTYADTLAENTRRVRELETLSFQYQLGTVETDIKRVYVQPNFHRIVRGYSLRPIYEALSRKFDHTMYDQQMIEDAENRFHGVSAFIADLKTWGLCDDKTCQTVRIACNQAADEISGAWSKALASLAARTGPGVAANSFSARLSGIDDLNSVLLSAEMTIAKALTSVEETLRSMDRYVRQLSVESEVKFLTGQEDVLNRLEEVARRSGPHFIREEDEQSTAFTSEMVSAHEGSLFIIAPTGFGKTTFCRWHALNDLERLLEEKSATLPVYFPLHQLTETGRDFKSTFLRTATVSALLPKDAQTRYDRTRVYLDGLDEIPELKLQKRVAELARQGTTSDPTLQVIITARDYVYGPWITWLPRIRLSGFSDSQISELVSKWLDGDSKRTSMFFDQLQKSRSLAELMEIPLLATLIVLVFKQTQKLPENKTRLYEIFVDLHNGGWDLVKSVQRPSRFPAAEKMFVLKHIAATIHKAKRREMLDTDAASVAKGTVKAANWDVLRSELLRDGLIVHQGAMIGFAHHSFQEFLTARYLLGELEREHLNQYCDDYLKGSDWWQEVLCFYIDLVARPQETRAWLRERVHRMGKSDLRLVAEKNLVWLEQHLENSFPFAR
jgi:hypothetical protein